MLQEAISIVKRLQDNGYEAVFAGGYVRDMLMKIPCNDIDIATSATPDQIESLFDKTLAIGKSFGVIVVIINNFEFEVATFRSDVGSDGRRPDSVIFTSMKEDALRRDLTINGLFYDPISNIIIDYVGGQQDINNQIIRFIGNADDRIKEDKLRMLRAIRFTCKYDFNISVDTFSAIMENATQVNSVSAERIQEELVKILKINSPSNALSLLNTSYLLQEILPEVSILMEYPQDPKWHPEGDVYKHTKLVIDELKNESTELLLAGLFHDIGKAKTTIIESDGRIRTPGHAKVGAEMTRDIMRRLKFSNDITKYVSELVYSHMSIKHFDDMRKANKKKFIYREDFQDLRKLTIADILGSHKNLDIITSLDMEVKNILSEPIKPTPFINGRDLIDLGYIQGKLIGTIKEEMYNLQLENKITSKQEAIEYIKKCYIQT